MEKPGQLCQINLQVQDSGTVLQQSGEMYLSTQRNKDLLYYNFTRFKMGSHILREGSEEVNKKPIEKRYLATK